jgi:hypothetical protein
MTADTAERLAEQALRISDDLNELVRDIEANEPDDEVARLRAAIGRVMWAVYYEILKPTLEEHPSVESEAWTEARAATQLGVGPERRPSRGSGR